MKYVSEGIDWAHRSEYIWVKHEMKTLWADEAFADPNRVWANPDPASKGGESARAIGYSETARIVITVIVVPKDANEWWGANAWKTKGSDLMRYRQAE